MKTTLACIACSAWLLCCAPGNAEPLAVPATSPGAATGLADSGALRATVYGMPPRDIAPLPASVPLQQIDIALPWARPVPAVFWFDRRLRVWFSAQHQPAPLAVVISGTGSGGNTASLALLRAVLYGAVTLKDGHVEQYNFNNYRVLRINEMPKVEVHIVPSTVAPTGVGEPGVAPLGPAVANAIFAATGTPVRKLPFANTVKS